MEQLTGERLDICPERIQLLVSGTKTRKNVITLTKASGMKIDAFHLDLRRNSCFNLLHQNA